MTNLTDGESNRASRGPERAGPVQPNLPAGSQILEQLELARAVLELANPCDDGAALAVRSSSPGELMRMVEDFSSVLREHARTARELAERDAWWRSILQHIPGTVVALGRNGDVLYTNRTSLADPDRQPPAEPQDESILAALRDAVPFVFESGQVLQLEIEGAAETGKPTYYSARVGPMPAPNGDMAAIAVVTDVSEQKRLDRELHELRRRNELIFHSVAEGICGFDAEGRLTFANPAAADLLGYAAEGLSGVHFGSLFQDNHQRPCTPIERALHGGETSRDHQAQLVKCDGSKSPISLTTSPIRESGRSVGVVVAFRDQSQWHELQAQLVQSQKLEAIGQLAAGIAHEINTPTQYIGDNATFARETWNEIDPLFDSFFALLAAVQSGTAKAEQAQAIEQLLDELDVAFVRRELPRALAQALDGVDRVTSIVRAMKAFSHPGTKERTATDLNQALKDTTTVARNEWKYVADLDLQLAEDLPLVPALVAQLNQAFLNLIVNAAHAIKERMEQTENKGTITIVTALKEKRVEVRIQDSGIGIPKDNVNRIFEPFFTTKPVGKGTGQGLAIVRNIIVDQHQGRITVESEPGVGTTFVVSLPVEVAEA